MRTHLDALLAPGALTAVFQPIVRIGSEREEVFAYEGLIRGPEGNFHHPDVLFGYVRRRRAEDRIDRACMRSILAAATILPRDSMVSINVHAATLGRDAAFGDAVVAEAEANGVDASRLILEVVEHGSAWNEPRYQGGIARLRQLGLAVALDDVGAGLSNYKMILDTRPDLFKIDRYLVHGCRDDASRRIMLASIHRLAADLGARVVAEGVEADDELRTLLDLGFELVQGYLFARPQPAQAFAESAA
jgi:EAL domain-containing protein (putative c-di-GMP-specific phosphodiesterase class I)